MAKLHIITGAYNLAFTLDLFSRTCCQWQKMRHHEKNFNGWHRFSLVSSFHGHFHISIEKRQHPILGIHQNRQKSREKLFLFLIGNFSFYCRLELVKHVCTPFNRFTGHLFVSIVRPLAFFVLLRPKAKQLFGARMRGSSKLMWILFFLSVIRRSSVQVEAMTHSTYFVFLEFSLFLVFFQWCGFRYFTKLL